MVSAKKRNAKAAGLAENGSSISSGSASIGTGIIRESASEVRKKSKADTTTSGYVSSFIRFLKFLESNHPDLVESHTEEDLKKIPVDDLLKLLKLPVPQAVVDLYLDKICYFDEDGLTKMRGKSTPENWWSTMVFVYGRRRNEEVCSGGMPGRALFKEFVSGMCNKKATHAQAHGKEREGKEAFTKKALYYLQQNSVDTMYTSLKQMEYCPLLGSTALNTGLRMFYCAHIAFPNLSFKVSSFDLVSTTITKLTYMISML